MHDVNFVFPNDAHPAWSIMIVLYPYITGLVAGAFVVSALYHVFHRDVLRPVARLALMTSLCFCAFATLPLLLHLHRPERCLNVLITPSPTSAIAGFGFIYSTYMLILIVEVWLVWRPVIAARAREVPGWRGWAYRFAALGVTEISPRSRAWDELLVRGLSLVGIPVACILHGYVGFLFGAIKANPWWSTALMPAIFLVSAIVSGIAALILLYQAIQAWQGEPSNLACVRSLAGYLWLFLILAVALEGLEILQMGYEGGGEWPILRELITGRLAVSYIGLQVILGSVVPLVLLPIVQLRSLPRRGVVAVSCGMSVLVLVQVLAMRWNIVVGGQLFSKSFRGFVDYHVDWWGREGLVMAAVILVLPLAALWTASQVVPLSPEEA